MLIHFQLYGLMQQEHLPLEIAEVTISAKVLYNVDSLSTAWINATKAPPS